MLSVLIVAAVLLLSHEAGHIVLTVTLGGRFQGLVFRGIAIGVALDLTGLSIRRQISTAWAGIGAEMFMAGWVGLLGVLGILDLRLFAWALLILAADALLNLGPWWSDSDGALIRRWGSAGKDPVRA